MKIEYADMCLAADEENVSHISWQTGSFTLRTLPAVFDELSEEGALCTRRRGHESDTGHEFLLEETNRIPFGYEPEVARKAKLADGLLLMTADYFIPGSARIRHLSGGGLRFEGPIEKIALLSIPKKGTHFDAPEFQSFKDAPDVLYDASYPPAGILLESEKERFEWAAGSDLWRWTSASRMGGTSRFIVKKEEDHLLFLWDLFQLSPSVEEGLRGHPWRITWAASSRTLKRIVRKKTDFVLSADSLECPVSASASASLKKQTAPTEPCFCASLIQNQLKKWVRSNLDKVKKGDLLALEDVNLHYCVNASHQDRARMESLPHWDLAALLEFAFWADRQLAPKGARLEFRAKKGSPFAGFMGMK